jgi:hypothetical protein
MEDTEDLCPASFDVAASVFSGGSMVVKVIVNEPKCRSLKTIEARSGSFLTTDGTDGHGCLN